ncbi:MAG: sigma-54 interaction domain-containing protein [Solidesulfovibrio sp.]
MENRKTSLVAGQKKENGWNFSMQSIFDNISECICIIDVDGYVRYWNSGGDKLYGIKPEEIFNNKIQKFFPNALGPRVLESGTTICRVEQHANEGSIVVISAAPIIVDGIVRGVISIDYDVGKFHFDDSDVTRVLSRTAQQECGEKAARQSHGGHNFGGIVYQSRQMDELVHLAKKVSKADTTVVITGESGTGKDLFAQAIHQESERKDGPFIIVDCSSISENLIESELFGYESGAFTGALKAGKPGKFELADGGTVFLDEIGELPLEMQAKLLRVLESKQFYRINGTKPVNVNVRIIAATNRSIEEMVLEKTFRKDLFYRLNVFSLHIPPLRERTEDISLLINYYLKHYSALNHKSIDRISPQLLFILKHYKWPGNIRELKNVIERLVVLAENSEINVQDINFLKGILQEQQIEDTSFNTFLELEAASLEVQKETILKALENSNYNMVKAAKILNIPRSTLYYKIEKLHMSPQKRKRGRPLTMQP